jgi:hypothetical protein
VINATLPGSQCPQNLDALSISIAAVGSTPASEDCLFLNVFAPVNATNLPVLVWIHVCDRLLVPTRVLMLSRVEAMDWATADKI